MNDNPLKQQILGNNFAYRPYFSQALSGISSVYLALGYRTKKRGCIFPIRCAVMMASYWG
ncbi:hypothetical protein [Aliamphritea spongicola]|nr:hypothetical protein [Aliamphritea spongicola]